MRTNARLIAAAAFCAMAAVTPAKAQVEKPHIAIGTASLGLTYLPLIIADQKGYFKEQGLDVEISAFPGGSKVLEALLGGSLDVASGAYSNTLTMAAKGQRLVEFADQVRCPGFVLMVSNRLAGKYKGFADLKGLRIGVSAPGSSTQMVLDYFLHKGGLDDSDVSIIGVGNSAGAVAAMRAGQIDVMINNEPLGTILAKDIMMAANMRSQVESDQALDGPYPEASLYAKADFVARNPKTVQALATAIVKADRWLQTATPDQVADAVPEEYLLGDRELYKTAFANVRTCLSPDGILQPAGAATVLRLLSDFDPDIKAAKINLDATYDNHFVQHALDATN